MNNSIWNKEDFSMAGQGEKFTLPNKIRLFFRCIKWSWQRVTRGYADCDVWDMDYYLRRLIPDMLQTLRDIHPDPPASLEEEYVDNEEYKIYATCLANRNKRLDRMIFLWRESNEETCSKKNPYKAAYYSAFKDFEIKYGVWGEKLQTDEELRIGQKNGTFSFHFMHELPEYKGISDKYSEEEKKLEEYRVSCKDEAMDMLKEHFYSLWD